MSSTSGGPDHGRGPAQPQSGRAIRQRFEMALRAGRIGTWHWDIATGAIDWDASMQELYGFADGSFDGTYETYAARLHPQDRPAVQAALDEALRTRSPEYSVEHRVLLPDGSVRWFASTGQLGLDASGEPAELIGVSVDVTGRREAELERTAARDAEGVARITVHATQRRMQMLAQASSLLDAPLDLDATLQQVADLAVAEIADWCVVDVVGESRVHHAAVAHRDPSMVAVAREMQERFPSDPDNPALVELLTTLEPLFVPQVDEVVLAASAHGPEHLELLLSLRLTSYLAVPLVAGGRGVGVILLASANGRRLNAQDVELAAELGRRAGAAVDKTRLYAELQATASTLQASLLPPTLPVIAGLALSAHYRSGTDGLDIGGDYYDVFRTNSERWWVVLGDVCGKGPGAAALAAAVRYTLHALAPDVDDPALLLRRLNDVLLAGNWEERFTTLALATFVTDAGTADGDVVPARPLRLDLVSGGHPPALLHRADGRISAVSGAGTLVGVLAELSLDVVSVELHAGDTLLLYTDGATEARDATGAELGQPTLVELLGATLADDGPDPARQLAEALAARAGGGIRDDLALLTLSR